MMVQALIRGIGGLQCTGLVAVRQGLYKKWNNLPWVRPCLEGAAVSLCKILCTVVNRSLLS